MSNVKQITVLMDYNDSYAKTVVADTLLFSQNTETFCGSG